MVLKHYVEGYDDFLKFIEKFEAKDPTFILYTGTKLPNGDSWCPDCVEAKPFIEKAIQKAPENYQFVTVEVGDRAFWKDNKCPFRTNSKTQLKSLPTLAKWGTQKRLEGPHLLDVELIDMLLTDEDD